MQAAADLFLILTQNLLFHHMLGLPALASAEQRGKGLVRTGLLTFLFCLICPVLMALLRPFLPERWERLLFPLCSVLICGILDILILLLCGLITKKLSRSIAPQLHASAFSCAVIGTILMSTDYTHETAIAFRCGFRAGIGYLAACLMLRLAAPVLCGDQVPASVRGWRAMYLYAGLLAMACACILPES